MIARLRALRGTEPVRLILWPIIGVLVAYGVQRGVVTGDVVSFVLPVLAVALGVPATAAIRSQVTPAANLADDVKNKAVVAVNDAAAHLDETLTPETRKAVAAITAQVVAYAGKHRAR